MATSSFDRWALWQLTHSGKALLLTEFSTGVSPALLKAAYDREKRGEPAPAPTPQPKQELKSSGGVPSRVAGMGRL